MRLVRSIVLGAIVLAAIALASGCNQEKWLQGQGVRASVALYPTAEAAVDPRFALGYYYYAIDKASDAVKYEFDFDFVPDWANLSDNYYMTLRADYLHLLGQTTWYAGGGGGMHYETQPLMPDSEIYFMVEGVIGYVWSLGSGENPFPLDLRVTVQYVFGEDMNAPIVVMGTLNYEF